VFIYIKLSWFNVQRKSSRLVDTWHDIAKPDGGHGDEAKVESVEEAPVLPDGEDAAADAEEGRQEGQRQKGR
jgi:hypothetical protein